MKEEWDGLALSCLGAAKGKSLLAEVPDLGACFRHARCWRAGCFWGRGCNGEMGVIRGGCRAGAFSSVGVGSDDEEPGDD